MSIQLQRDYTGTLSLVVGGIPAGGAKVTSMQQIDGELGAVVFIPLKYVTLGEVNNVVPLVRPEK